MLRMHGLGPLYTFQHIKLSEDSFMVKQPDKEDVVDFGKMLALTMNTLCYLSN